MKWSLTACRIETVVFLPLALREPKLVFPNRPPALTDQRARVRLTTLPRAATVNIPVLLPALLSVRRTRLDAGGADGSVAGLVAADLRAANPILEGLTQAGSWRAWLKQGLTRQGGFFPERLGFPQQLDSGFTLLYVLACGLAVRVRKQPTELSTMLVSTASERAACAKGHGAAH